MGVDGVQRWLTVRKHALVMGAAGLAGFLAIGHVVLKVTPDLLAETDGLDAKGQSEERQNVRTAALALLAGTIGVWGAIFTARGFALNRSGQLTDRFTKAIDQLGRLELDVRLGGIYALERIARDSPEDRAQVFEVLTAFIREHAPREDAPAEAATTEASAPKRGPGGRVQVRPLDRPRPATDVQAVLTVLGRRSVADQDKAVRLDLSGSDLRGAILDDAQLVAADLARTDLRHASLRGAQLRRASLHRADARGAEFAGADLSHAHLRAADLRRARLQSADLSDAELSGADLRGASFRNAQLTSARLSDKLGSVAKYDERTRWPSGFDPEAAGARLKEDA